MSDNEQENSSSKRLSEVVRGAPQAKVGPFEMEYENGQMQTDSGQRAPQHVLRSVGCDALQIQVDGYPLDGSDVVYASTHKWSNALQLGQ